MRKKRVQPDLVYKNQDEISFLKQLGRGMAAAARVNLLLRYRATLARRSKWDRLDPEIIKAYLNLEIGGRK